MADNNDNIKSPAPRAWSPAQYELADLTAIQRLAAGTATPDDQKRALRWIIEAVCATYELSYRPEGERDTAFAEGRRFVGLQLVKALHLNVSSLKRRSLL